MAGTKKPRTTKGKVTHALAEGHKVVREAEKVNSWVAGAEAITSGNPRRGIAWGVRKLGYHFFAIGMNKVTGRIKRVSGKKKTP